jgi:hypothetical protein
LLILPQIRLCGILDNTFVVDSPHSLEAELSTIDVDTAGVTCCRENYETGKWDHCDECPKGMDNYWEPFPKCLAEKARSSKRRLVFLQNIVFMMNLCYHHPELAAEQRTLRCYEQTKFITNYE